MTANWQKDAVWKAWESFILSLCLLLFYIPNCAGFYMYTLTASIFREELKRIVIRCFHLFFLQRQTRVTTLKVAVIRTQKR